MTGRIFALSWVVGLITAMAWPFIHFMSQNGSSAAQSSSQSSNTPASIVIQVPNIVTHKTTFKALGRGNHFLFEEDLWAGFSEEQKKWDDRAPLLKEAWAALQDGNVRWENGEKTDALAQWESVARKYHNTDAALAALWNIGSACREMGDTDASIQAFKALVEFPDPTLKEREIIPDSDRKHRACLELSDLFLEGGNLGSALVYSDLALDVHSTRVPDPFYREYRANELRQRIRSIQSLTD